MEFKDYNHNVFLNCPFDDKYKELFYTAIFAVMDCGFSVRCALETTDASQVRIQRIYEQIASCRFGIHDLSRTQLDKKSQLPRFNMPLELGIFLGAKFLGDEKQKEKNLNNFFNLDSSFPSHTSLPASRTKAFRRAFVSYQFCLYFSLRKPGANR